MAKNRARTDPSSSNSESLGINSVGKRKGSEDHDSEDEKRSSKAKRVDKSIEHDHRY